MRIIGNDQNNNGQNFWEILERIISKISSIIGAGLIICICDYLSVFVFIWQKIDQAGLDIYGGPESFYIKLCWLNVVYS